MLRLIPFASALYLRLYGARRQCIGVGPARIIYYSAGPEEGEPWLLLHGMGSFAASWGPVLSGLRRECRLLAPELSDLGGTQAPGGGLGIRGGALAAASLIERCFGGRPATVAGLSLGGWMAVRLALERPDLVSRLVLIDAGGYRNQDWEKIQEMANVSDLAGVDRLYEAFFVRRRWLRPSRRAFLRAYTSPGVRKVLARTTEDDAFDDADLARIKAPTALIWGEQDGLFRVEGARAMAAALPCATLDVLPGCGHVLHWDHPQGMMAALQKFRRAHPVPAGTAAARVALQTAAD